MNSSSTSKPRKLQSNRNVKLGLVILGKLYCNCGHPKTSRLWLRWFLMLNFKNFALNVLAGPYRKFLAMKKFGNFTWPNVESPTDF